MQPSAAHNSAPRTNTPTCEPSTAGPEMSGNSDVFTLVGTTSGWMLFRQASVAAVRCVRARAFLKLLRGLASRQRGRVDYAGRGLLPGRMHDPRYDLARGCGGGFGTGPSPKEVEL